MWIGDRLPAYSSWGFSDEGWSVCTVGRRRDPHGVVPRLLSLLLFRSIARLDEGVSLSMLPTYEHECSALKLLHAHQACHDRFFFFHFWPLSSWSHRCVLEFWHVNDCGSRGLPRFSDERVHLPWHNFQAVWSTPGFRLISRSLKSWVPLNFINESCFNERRKYSLSASLLVWGGIHESECDWQCSEPQLTSSLPGMVVRSLRCKNEKHFGNFLCDVDFVCFLHFLLFWTPFAHFLELFSQRIIWKEVFKPFLLKH